MAIVLKNNADFSDFGVADWNLDIKGALERLLADCIKEALAPDDDEDAPCLRFPIEWYPDDEGNNEPPPNDPLTVYVYFPMLSTINGMGPRLKFNIRQALADSLEDCSKDGSFSEGLALLADAFQEFADHIKSVIVAQKG